ncbi:MAG: hypothetical protein NTY88_09805 [Bacteroidetes bacterium]|nr:hypothetical protein [Bacteroidota bacterium]
MKNNNDYHELNKFGYGIHAFALIGVLLLSLLLVTQAKAQANLYNDGGTIHVDKDAILYIEGDLNNKLTSTIENDGVIELLGDLTNDNTAEMKNGSDNSSTERVYKFTGPAIQYINGDLSNAATRYFYNLVIDKANSEEHVALKTNVEVTGSLVFGSGTTGADTYTPTSISTLSDHAGNGIINTYDALDNDYELFVSNPAAAAVAGYAALTINSAPRDAYIQTRGAQGVGLGGFARNVSGTGVQYVFPVGSFANGYNASALTFSNIGGGTDKVRSMFVNATGGVGAISQYCSGCNGLSPDNTGFNYMFNSNPCNGSVPQWVIFDVLPQDHGYWSFEGNSGDQYLIETYPNSFPGFAGDGSDNWRMIKKSGSIDAVPSGDWTPSITSSITDTADLLTYTRNGGCYSGDGVPGGMYTGFSHFHMARTSNSNTLPVDFIYLTA